MGMLDDEFDRLTREYKVSSLKRDSVSIDADISVEDALGSAGLSAQATTLHGQIQPFLVVVPVLYHGLEQEGVRFGQIVVHQKLRYSVESLFEAFFKARFQIARVVPASMFEYSPRALTAHNATFGYLPVANIEGALSTHAKGWAIDFNPQQNPVMIDTKKLKHREPADAEYRPGEPGVLTRDSVARQIITAREFEWGGNWGATFPDPATEYLEHGHFVYRHIEPNGVMRSRLKLHLPTGW